MTESPISEPSMMCGGIGPEQNINDHIRDMVKKLQPQVETKLERKLERFEPISIRSQVVAGMNHFVKCHIGGEDYRHLKIYEPLPCHHKEPELVNIHPETKTLADKIDYFD